MSGPKIIVVLLVCVAVLFVAVLFAGNRKGSKESSTEIREHWSGILRKLVHEPDVAAEEIESPCIMGTEFHVMGGQECSTTIRSSRRARRLALHLTSGPGLNVHFEPSDENKRNEQITFDFTLTRDPKKSDCTVRVPPKGGTLRLTCVPSGGAPPEECHTTFKPG